MVESLLAILLVTTSARDSNLVYRWPQNPQIEPRLSRPRPDCASSPAHLDNVWKASTYGESKDPYDGLPHVPLSDPEYEWKQSTSRNEHQGAGSRARSTSTRRSPSTERSATKDEYETLFGYSTSFLANLLCPQRSMCHQRCELLVDDLVFIGHPVCVDTDGEWRFRHDKVKSSARGRETRSSQIGSTDTVAEESPDRTSLQDVSSKASWLTTFNLVLVLDPPEPSSSASGSFLKYLDVVYRQIAFSLMAVLFQQQVLSNFVERECDILGSLKDNCIAKEQTLDDFASQALEASSIAAALKSLYDAIKSSSMAYITINNIPLELQLPPFLDQLLHSEDDELIYQPLNEDDAAIYKQAWGEDLSEDGWNLPSLDPWKSLLMLDSSLNVRTPYIDHEENSVLLEGLVKFMDIASVTLSLGDMASLLDWDYETQIIPTVRWLVQHRRARVVDIVHNGLKTVFTLPPKFSAPLRELAEDFEKDFSEQPVSSLPEILSAISTSSSQNHFSATVVQTKDLLPLYHDVVIWMLKREMLITLHLRVRVVATKELKLRVKHRIEKARAKKHGSARGRSKLHQQVDADSPPAPYVALSPKTAHAYTRRDILAPQEYEQEEEDEEDDPGPDDSGWDTADDETRSSMIPDPGRATALQNRWLLAMSDGMDPRIANQFNQILQYFDGKHTDDEILFKAEISRKQLRQILHHYDEYLQTFLHP